MIICLEDFLVFP